MRNPRRMSRLGTLIGALLVSTALTAPAATAAPSAIDFSGTVALSNCSGSLVKLAGAPTSGAALVLTNGHCYEGGFLNPGQVLVNKSSSRSFTLLSPSGGNLGTLRATKVAYATMTDTDMTLYQLNTTYDAIKSRYNISPLEISSAHPTAGTAIKVVSGYWKKIYSCNIDGFVYRLKESDWTWKDSIRYTSTCNTIGGTSGSPIEDPSGKLIGINNTGNENGEQCTLDNPCEVDQNGNVTVHEGTNYGEETYLLAGCMTGSTVNLNLAGCALPKP
ncbi:serine protease [Kutzneria buriramensis]|uniref:Trypsin-like peptidase n=1 Tax=Kutzneria buriramensis TaxID=1045776 RepID=A0A3E0HGG2_9PSEU|nr:trypsin-like peptidase [Kutzneria buriramensis]